MRKIYILIFVFCIAISYINAQSCNPTITGNATICSGNSTILTGIGATSYTWMPGGTNTNTISVNPTTNTTYTLISATGTCTATNTITVNVNSIPTVTLTPYTTICPSGSGTFCPGGATTYTWFPSSYITPISGGCFVANPPSNTSYTIVGTDSYGCVGSTYTSINIDVLFVAFSPTSYTICQGQTLSPGSMLHVTGNMVVSWEWTGPSGFSSSQTDPTVNSSSPSGVYTVTVTDANGCVGTDTDTINVSSNIPPTITVNSDTTCYGNAIPMCANGAITYSWSPSSWISSTVGNCTSCAPLASIIYTVTGTDVNGCSAAASSTITLAQCVWPGDADENLTVDNNDLLTVGLKYGIAGSSRNVQGNLWEGYLCNNWNDTLSNGTNSKYVDCDGSGLIDFNDTLAINSNYGQTHPLIRVSEPQHIYTANPDVFIQFNKTSYTAGDTVLAFVNIGSNVTPQSNFYGSAFTIDYDETKVQAGTEQFYFNNSWVGTINVNTIKFGKLFTATGITDASLVRINHSNTTGFGKVATLQFVLKNSLSNAQLYFTISNAIKINSLGTSTPLTSGTDSVTVLQQTTEISQTETHQILIYPNPATNIISLNTNGNNNYQNSTVTIQNTLGQTIKKIPFTKNIDVSDLSEGCYFLQITLQSGEIYKIKFIKQ